MSLNSITSEEVERARESLSLNGQTAGLKKTSDKQISNALSTLIRYIPTEVVTLYIAAIAALATQELGVWHGS